MLLTGRFLKKSAEIMGMLLLLFIACPAFSQQNESPPPTKEAAPAKQPSEEKPKENKLDPQQRIEAIQTERKALKETVEATRKRLALASSKGLEQQADWLKKQVELLETLDLIYSQQMAALERLITLMAQKKQYQEEMAQPVAEAKETVSFLELDRIREELNEQLQRKETLKAKIDFAESALEQAQNALKEREKAVQEFKEASAVSAEETPRSSEKEQLEALKLKARLAAETIQLRELELRNEELARSVYQTQIDLLEKKAAFLKKRAVFTQEGLQKQIQALDRKELELNRELARALDRQIVVKGRLARARERLAQNDAERQKIIEAEVETRRLEAEALKAKIESLSEQIELLANRKTAWQRRYTVFNLAVDYNEWGKWKSEASQKIEQLEREQHLLNLSLADWQNQLITLNNTIDKGEAPARLQWLKLQQKQIQQIIGGLQGLQTFLENTRRLQEKLVAEITDRTARRTLGEWLDLIVNFEIYQNKVQDWLYAVVIGAFFFTFFLYVRRLVVTRLQRYAEIKKITFANGFVASAQRTSTLFLLALAIFIGASFLDFNPKTTLFIRNVIKVALILQATIWISDFVRAWIFRYLGTKAKRGEESRSALGVFNFISQALVWSMALLLALQNFGVDITALVAGLGIGGVAVALALQRVLGDLFSSLAIVLDKPFVTGDFIIFDNTFLGSVEHIGIKTTRLRSLGGEQIICSNSDLLNARIRNYKRMRERRVVFTIGVVYQTPYEKLEKISTMLREIIEAQENARFDRAHFFQYGDFALHFEIVYYVLSPDYNLYMDIQQAINLQIFKRFSREGIAFAYPTQSLYLQAISESRDTEFKALKTSAAQ